MIKVGLIVVALMVLGFMGWKIHSQAKDIKELTTQVGSITAKYEGAAAAAKSCSDATQRVTQQVDAAQIHSEKVQAQAAKVAAPLLRGSDRVLAAKPLKTDTSTGQCTSADALLNRYIDAVGQSAALVATPPASAASE
jgi:hypothetical protein